MTTTLDEAPRKIEDTYLAMSLKDAENAIQEWQGKLDKSRADFADIERNIGQIALTQGVDNATQQMTRLQVEVRMAATALAAAIAQRDEIRRREQLERAKRIRAEAAELDAEAEDHATFLREWGPKVEAAHHQMIRKTQRSMALISQADDLDRKYGGTA